MKVYLAVLLFVAMAFALPASGQENTEQDSPQCMPGMKMPGCPDTSTSNRLTNMQPPETLVQRITSHAGAGTSVEPISTPTPMMMKMRGSWMFMFHANAFLLDQQQSGPR